MRDISKAAFYTSYYEAAQKLKTDDERHEFYDALLDYIFTEKEPVNVSYNVDLILTAVLPIVNADLKRKNGGAPQGNNNAKKTTKKQPIVLDVENNLKTMTKTNNVNDNDNVNVNVNVNENENVNAVDTTTPPQKNYCKLVFELYKNAGLPCGKNNEITFLQTDFKNALGYIHNSKELCNFTSKDIIGAVENYITVYKDPTCYVDAKMNFYALVKSKWFYNLLPSNFDIKNFKRFDAKQEEQKPVQKIWYNERPCPECHTKKVYYDDKKQKMVCEKCGKEFDVDEFLGGEV